MGQCQCGCGVEVREGSRFIRGHNIRVRKSAGIHEGVQVKGGEEYGVHGTPIFGGTISEDFNEAFRDLQRAIATFDEMRRTDATVQAVLLALELPIIQAEWNVVPATEDPRDKVVAEFVRWNLFEGMTISFRDFLRQALGMHWAGFSVFEKVFEEKRFGHISLIGWKKLAQRLPQSIVKWEFDESGGPKGVWQYVPGRGSVFIPIWKLLIFTNRKEGGNIQGQSFLRAAYKHFVYKDRLYRLQAIGLERDVTGIPIVTLPQNASKRDKEIARQIATSLRRDENAGLVMPETWKLELLAPGRGGSFSKEEAILEAIRHHDLLIARAILAQVINLGDSPRGSYALGVTLADLLTLAIEAQADSIAETINHHAIRQLVDLNFPGIRYPRLMHGEVRRRDLRQLQLIFSGLAQSGLLDTQDDTVRATVRRRFGLEEFQPAGSTMNFDTILSELRVQNDTEIPAEAREEVEHELANEQR